MEGSEITDHRKNILYFLSSSPLIAQSAVGLLSVLCQTSLPPSWKSLTCLSLCRRRCRWGNARNCVPSHCSASARQPEAPLTPLPLYFSLLYEKPKSGLPLKVNCFKSLSALLPSRCLSPWCLDICRPGHGFWWNPQFRPSASEADVLSRAPERCYQQEVWSGWFCF